MRKHLLFFATLLFLQLSGKSQYNTVEKIRAYYTKVNADITTAIKTKVGEYCNEVTVNATKASWPAVGNYQKKISIWYADDPVAAGDGKPLHLLDKVNMTAESAGNKYAEEYLFADGELLFYAFFDFYKYNGVTQKDEHRVYFSKGKVIKYDLKEGGHNEYARSKDDVPVEAIRHGNMMKQLFLNSCEYIPEEIP